MVITADFQAAGSEYSAGGARRGCRATGPPIDVNSSELRSRSAAPRWQGATTEHIGHGKHSPSARTRTLARTPIANAGARAEVGIRRDSLTRRFDMNDPAALAARAQRLDWRREWDSSAFAKAAAGSHRVSDAIPPCQCCHEGLTSAWLGCRNPGCPKNDSSDRLGAVMIVVTRKRASQNLGDKTSRIARACRGSHGDVGRMNDA